MKHILKNISLADGSTLVITQPQPEDAQQIIDFLNQVGGETDNLTFGLNEFTIPVAEQQKTIAACLQ